MAGSVQWVSTEHNIDAFFFLRKLAATAGNSTYAAAAERIERALVVRAWLPDAGQMTRGIDVSGPDRHLALDCASWGALFLCAAGERLKAETSLAVARTRYASRDPATSARGCRPHAHAPLFENRVLADFFRSRIPVDDWDRVEGVWPEGTAGVALAALRLGDREAAQRLLSDLEPLRGADGALPAFTREIPFELDAQPSLASTLWVELVRFELVRPAGRATLWTGH